MEWKTSKETKLKSSLKNENLRENMIYYNGEILHIELTYKKNFSVPLLSTLNLLWNILYSKSLQVQKKQKKKGWWTNKENKRKKEYKKSDNKK